MSVYPRTPVSPHRQTATMISPAKRALMQGPAAAAQAPNAPGAPSLTQGPASTLIVAWSAPPVDLTHGAATGFNLLYSSSGAGTWTTVTNVTSPYTLSGLSAGASYDVELVSSNAAGTSAASPISTLATANGAPNTPGAPVLTQGAGTSLTVIWTAPAIDSLHNAATTYSLQSSPSGLGQWTIVSGVTSPYTLTGLIAGAAIDVQIQASNSAGASLWSASSTLTTAGGSPNLPNVPTALTLVHGTGSNLTVTWTASAVDATHAAATSYALRSSPSGAGTWTTVSNVTSPYTLTGLAAGAAIDVEVQAVNASGSSAWSATSTLTTATGGSFAPNAPTAPMLAQGTGSNLTVTWTASTVDATHSAATGYTLRSSPSGAGTWTTVANVTSPYTLTGLTAGAPYDVEIEAFNTTGTSAWSPISTMTTAPASGSFAPNAPVVTVTPAFDGTTTKLTATWGAPAVDATHGGATAYNLRYGPSGAGSWTTVSAVTSPYTITGLAAAAAYDVEVQGTNASTSPGAWSAIATASTFGATVTQGGWTAAATQVHGTSVAPNGGVQMVAIAAPTAVTGGAFAWSASNTAIPTSGLITAPADGVANGYGQYFSAPATAGTYYLWLLAQGASGTVGALVTSAITVT